MAELTKPDVKQIVGEAVNRVVHTVVNKAVTGAVDQLRGEISGMEARLASKNELKSMEERLTERIDKSEEFLAETTVKEVRRTDEHIDSLHVDVLEGKVLGK